MRKYSGSRTHSPGYSATRRQTLDENIQRAFFRHSFRILNHFKTFQHPKKKCNKYGSTRFDSVKRLVITLLLRHPAGPGAEHSLYLVVLLQYVVHLGDVLTGHRLDDEPVVVAGQEAVPEAALGVAVERSAPRQRVL